MTDFYSIIREAVTNAAGISVSAALAAIDGSRHVLPPTYADAPHATTGPSPAWVTSHIPLFGAGFVEAV